MKTFRKRLWIGWIFGYFAAYTAWNWVDVSWWWAALIVVGFGVAAAFVAESRWCVE